MADSTAVSLASFMTHSYKLTASLQVCMRLATDQHLKRLAVAEVFKAVGGREVCQEYQGPLLVKVGASLNLSWPCWLLN